MITTPRTFPWGKTLALAIILVLLIGLVGPAFIPARTTCCGGSVGSDLREMVMNVLFLRSDEKPWPTSMADYQEQCRIAGLVDNLPRKQRQVFVAWDQFPRAEAERQSLPVCVIIRNQKAVIGFTDGHFETINKSQLVKFPALLPADPSLAAPQ